MRKSVSKLTATTLKRIIAEEKQKLKKAGVIKEKKKLTESQKLSLLLKLKNIQLKKLKEAKKINIVKNKLKKNLLKGI